jgi:hypothetical protein
VTPFASCEPGPIGVERQLGAARPISSGQGSPGVAVYENSPEINWEQATAHSEAGITAGDIGDMHLEAESSIGDLNLEVLQHTVAMFIYDIGVHRRFQSQVDAGNLASGENERPSAWLVLLIPMYHTSAGGAVAACNPKGWTHRRT